jgi:hypothetical protein
MTFIEDAYKRFVGLRANGGTGRRGKGLPDEQAFRLAVSALLEQQRAEDAAAIEQLRSHLAIARREAIYSRDGVTATAEGWASIAALLRAEVRQLKAASNPAVRVMVEVD